MLDTLRGQREPDKGMYFTDRRESRQGVRVSANTSCIGQFMIHKQDLSIALTFTNLKKYGSKAQIIEFLVESNSIQGHNCFFTRLLRLLIAYLSA